MKLLLINFLIFFSLVFNFNKEIFAKKLDADYKVEFGPINIGSLKWTLDLDKGTYLTSIFLKDKGLFSGLYKFSGEYSSEGKVINGEFISSKYNQIWKTKKKTKSVKILFNKKMVVDLVLKPKEKEMARINYLKINGLVDPLSSFLNILVNHNNDYKTIDGRRLYKMSLNSKKKDGGVLLKEIYISDYFNIWADHKRNDLEFIFIEQDLLKEKTFFPKNIKIKNKGLVFKLTKI